MDDKLKVTDRGGSAERTMLRQGDVLLVPVTLRGGRGEVVQRGQVVLAEGEASGHAHVVRSRRVELRRVGGRTVLVVAGSALVELVHEEHATLPVAPGAWEVVRQREYRPDGVRRSQWVAD